jgi:hypothetical protein
MPTMPTRTRDFTDVIPEPGFDLDARLPNGKLMTEAQARAECRAIGEGDFEAARWIAAGGVASNEAAVGQAARDALRAVNDRWSLTAMRALFEVRAFHWGFREGVASAVRREANRGA